MSARIDGHARFRELISARLDGPLTPRDQRKLIAHLAQCADCRTVERDYRDQRNRLRALPAAPPPREMWARTAAALDRQVAGNGGYRPVHEQAGPSPRRRVAFTTLAVAGLVMAGAVSQLPQTARPDDGGLPLLMATPFGVPSQALAFLGSNEKGLALYQTKVDVVCPAAAPECVYDDEIEPSIMALPHNLRPSNLALSPSGRQLAIVGRAPLEREDLIGVVTMPDDATSPGTPAATPPADVFPSAPAAVMTSAPSLAPASDGEHALTTAPPTDAIEGLTVLAIVEGVRSTGAPPAWSADGSMLAFSAMPADGSQGPDVYVWRPDDPLAERVTHDHRSYFASWSDSRIVMSRVDQAEPADPISVETVVIDPRTGEQRRVAADLWLPAVSPLGRHAVSWFGSLEWKDLLASPLHGALYVADWSALDPFAERPPGEPSASPVVSLPNVEPRSPSPSAEAAEPSPTTAVDRRPDPTMSADGAAAEETPDPFNPQEQPNHSPAATPEALPVAPEWLTAVEPQRDPQASPVVDWQVRWSSDGKALGYWVTDVPGASWGRLVVLALDPQTGIVDHDLPLLEPTLARRGFTLGLSRVAWVAPGESGSEGELRVRTWGLDGVGLLRLRRFELTEVMPAF